MTYYPITETEKAQWIDWLQNQVNILSQKRETAENYIFETPEGDVATAKDIVGNLLALLTNKTVII